MVHFYSELISVGFFDDFLSKKIDIQISLTQSLLIELNENFNSLFLLYFICAMF